MAGQTSFADFAASVEAGCRPAGLSAALDALWLEARGEWAAAHERVQQDGSRDGAWVHAYLHRREGDEANAGYWYARAGKPSAQGDLAEEWRQIAEALTASSRG